MKKIGFLSLSLFLLTSLPTAQTPDRPPPPPSEPPSQGSGNTGGPTTRRQYRETVLNLSGKVIFEDGQPPPDSLQVELSCSGRVIRQTHTASKGDFHFEIGQRVVGGVFDATVGGSDFPGLASQAASDTTGGGSYLTPEGIRVSGQGRFDMNGCEVRLSNMPGYSSNYLTLGFRSVFDKSDVGVIILRRRGEVQGTLVSLNSLKAPRNARSQFEKATKELRKDRNKVNFDKVTKHLQKAVSSYPDYAAAWNLLGEVRFREQKDNQGAREALNKAISVDQEYIAPYITLSQMELTEGRYDEAEKYAAKLTSMDPSLSQGQYLRGLSAYYLKKLEVAEEAFRVIEENKEIARFPAVYFMKGDILARKGDVPAAAVEFRTYLASGPVPPTLKSQISAQLSQWEADGLLPKPIPPNPDQQ